jgi:hypothetical protein
MTTEREVAIGHLANLRSVALPTGAAIGGMAAPAILYALLIPTGPWSRIQWTGDARRLQAIISSPRHKGPAWAILASIVTTTQWSRSANLSD